MLCKTESGKGDKISSGVKGFGDRNLGLETLLGLKLFFNCSCSKTYSAVIDILFCPSFDMPTHK